VEYIPPPSAPPKKPSLYVAAVGVSEHPEKPLKYANLDAKRVASVLEKRGKGLFAVVPPKIAEDATKENIIACLKWLRENMSPIDVGVFFYSGHGIKDEEGTFHFLPKDGSEDNPATWVSDVELQKNCPNQGNLALLIDACHSGDIDLGDLIRVFNRDEHQIVLLASSEGEQKSYENDELEAGYFAYAAREGLEGKADFLLPTSRDSKVYARELAYYVKTTVGKLTGGLQRPVSTDVEEAHDFPLTVVTRVGS
jgi:hypothetical protein